MCKDAGSPFDSMNFGHQGGVNQSGMVKEVVVCPVWIFLLQAIADDVVFFDEKSMQQAHPNPPVVIEARPIPFTFLTIYGLAGLHLPLVSIGSIPITILKFGYHKTLSGVYSHH